MLESTLSLPLPPLSHQKTLLASSFQLYPKLITCHRLPWTRPGPSHPLSPWISAVTLPAGPGSPHHSLFSAQSRRDPVKIQVRSHRSCSECSRGCLDTWGSPKPHGGRGVFSCSSNLQHPRHISVSGPLPERSPLQTSPWLARSRPFESSLKCHLLSDVPMKLVCSPPPPPAFPLPSSPARCFL